MERLQANKPILHAVMWILIYIVLVNIGDNISSLIGVDAIATAPILIVFSLALLLYVKKNNWFALYGFKGITKSDLKKTLFYIPLMITVSFHYFRGINQELGYTGFILAFVLMLSVGFLEELIFRGFLYQGILKESGMRRAVLISGITFAFGHIVNLLRGYTIANQINQIVIGIFIGILLALLVAFTNSIIPGVIYHILFNFSGTITNSNLRMETYMVIATCIICTLYSIYILKAFNSKRDYQSTNL